MPIAFSFEGVGDLGARFTQDSTMINSLFIINDGGYYSNLDHV